MGEQERAHRYLGSHTGSANLCVDGLGSEGNPLTLLGNVRIDEFPLIAQSTLAQLLDWGDVHKFLGNALMWLAGLYAAAGIYHGLVLKDGVLASMLPYKT